MNMRGSLVTLVVLSMAASAADASPRGGAPEENPFGRRRNPAPRVQTPRPAPRPAPAPTPRPTPRSTPRPEPRSTPRPAPSPQRRSDPAPTPRFRSPSPAPAPRPSGRTPDLPRGQSVPDRGQRTAPAPSPVRNRTPDPRPAPDRGAESPLRFRDPGSSGRGSGVSPGFRREGDETPRGFRPSGTSPTTRGPLTRTEGGTVQVPSGTSPGRAPAGSTGGTGLPGFRSGGAPASRSDVPAGRRDNPAEGRTPATESPPAGRTPDGLRAGSRGADGAGFLRAGGRPEGRTLGELPGTTSPGGRLPGSGPASLPGATAPGRDGFVRGAGSGPSTGGEHGSKGGARGSGGLVVSGHAGDKTSASPHGYAHEGTRAWDDDFNRVYRKGFRHGYRVGYDDGHRDRYDRWYDDHRIHLSFSFGFGTYFGVRYYTPYHHWVSGCDFAFFYPEPVTYTYVPYGFYCDTTPVYVTRYEYVRRNVPVTVYETTETVTVEEVTEILDAEGDAAAPAGGDDAADATTKVDPVPAAGSPATEKFLREGSEHFRRGEYYEAAVQFRLAALSAPGNTGPLFALSQALTAMGEDAYAARVLRKAVETNPLLLQETGDLAGVYRDADEFARVLQELEGRAAASPVDGDARFLLGAVRYFTGDPRARDVFRIMAEALPEDGVVAAFRTATDARFAGADDLPPVQKPTTLDEIPVPEGK